MAHRPDMHELTDREREILRLVVRSFVDTAGPVGSRYLARTFELGLSAASIRNTMSDLEELGYLGHPYTSAGRVPTEQGYRKFVDELMETPTLSANEKQLLRAELEQLMGDTSELARESSRLLGRLSSLLGVALTPKLSEGVLERLEIVQLSSSRLMFVLSVQGGLVRTIIFEVDSDLTRAQIDRIVVQLNERLAGLSLDEIRRTYENRIRDLGGDAGGDRNGIIRLVMEEAPQLFSEEAEGRRVRLGGAQNILAQPEFQEPGDLRRLFEMIEDEDQIAQLLEGHSREASEEGRRATVTIGSENDGEGLRPYSIVTARYSVGDLSGTIGVIGPTRMNYGRIVTLVENMADLLSQPLGGDDEASD